LRKKKTQEETMGEKRYMGVDLHRKVFTCCMRLESGRQFLSEWRLEQLPQFVKKLRSTDEVAVEVTGNTRLFYEAVSPHAARVVVVDPNQFRVISQSVKKTDTNDARNLALYLAKGLLPEVRMKEKQQAQVASLTQTRDRLVKLRTALKNKVNHLLSARGIELEKEELSSEKGLTRALTMEVEELTQLEVQVIVEQIRSLNQSIAKLEEVIDREGKKLKGHRNLTSIKGIGSLGASILLSVIGDVRDFPDEGRLALFRDRTGHPQLERDGALGRNYQARQQAGSHRPGAMRTHRQTLQPLSGKLLRANPQPAWDRPGHHRPGP
jgi:transposase